MDDHDDDASDDVRRLFVTLNIVYLNTIFALFGIFANVINMRVFIKQGFSENINISLFVLAVADLGELLTVLVFSVCNNPAFAGAGLPLSPGDFINVVAAFPRGVLSHIKSCVTAFITFERCMCVVLPLKVKAIITTRVTVFFLCVIIVGMAVTLIPFYQSVRIDWQYDITLNRTILSAIFSEGGGSADMNAILSTYTGVQVGTFLAVSLFSFILAFKLWLQSKFRSQQAHSSENAKRQNSKKSATTIALVITMAATYVTCYSPGILILLVGFVEPRFSVFGSLVNYFMVCVSYTILFESINSSVTIFLYFAMSTNYRKTLFTLFR
ncbi:G-protein coupled receptor [Biomphalaria glabrata]|nr:G-protein coupled receptor [Biomphalaria glabrata]